VDEWVSQREAGRLLGVHASAVSKMVRRGDLAPRAGRPSLSRAAVLALRDARAAAAATREGRRQPVGPRPPDGDHVWLRAAGAAAVMGVSSIAVSARARRGRLPFTERDAVRCFALDQLELVGRADQARRTGRP
jgi:hypothetical protein